MSPGQSAMYGLITQLIEFLWTTPEIAFVAVPFFMMFAVMRFLNWSTGLSRGGTAEQLDDELERAHRAYQLQRQGFSRPQQAAARRQRAGSRFRFRP
jgi:hypothetical protein